MAKNDEQSHKVPESDRQLDFENSRRPSSELLQIVLMLFINRECDPDRANNDMFGRTGNGGFGIDNVASFRSARPSLDTLPGEILNMIFSLCCAEDLDLSLLSVSGSIMGKLTGSPIVQILRAFIPAPQDLLVLETLCINTPNVITDIVARNLVVHEEHDRVGVQCALLHSTWCRSSFLERLQVLIVKRLVLKYWDPLLKRDGLRPSAICYPRLWQALDSFSNSASTPSKALPEVPIRVADSDKQYSWTELRLWPLEGRVAIRDRLANRTVEVQIPLLWTVAAAAERVAE